MPNSRLDAKKRKEQLVIEGVKLAGKVGYLNVTQKALVQKLKISSGLVIYHFGTMEDFRKAMIAYAVKHEIIDVIRDAVFFRDLPLKKVPEHIKKDLFKEL